MHTDRAEPHHPAANSVDRNSGGRKSQQDGIHDDRYEGSQYLNQRRRNANPEDCADAFPVRFLNEGERNLPVPSAVDQDPGEQPYKLSDYRCDCRTFGAQAEGEDEDGIQYQISDRSSRKREQKQVGFAAGNHKPVEYPLSHLAQGKQHADAQIIPSVSRNYFIAAALPGEIPADAKEADDGNQEPGTDCQEDRGIGCFLYLFPVLFAQRLGNRRIQADRVAQSQR